MAVIVIIDGGGGGGSKRLVFHCSLSVLCFVCVVFFACLAYAMLRYATRTPQRVSPI